MNKFLATIVLAGATTAAHAADWTPLFKHYERGQDIDKATVMNEFFWSASVCMTTIEELKECSGGLITNKKPKLPAKYAKDLGKTRLTADGNAIYTPVKGGMLYGFPIKGFKFTAYDYGEGAMAEVDFGPMTQRQFNQLKSKAQFAEYWGLKDMYNDEPSCEPYAGFKRVNGRGVLWFNPYISDETEIDPQILAEIEAGFKAAGCRR
ncbi:hypothetical protein [Moraxella canis]|uniref:hypothetical protein n=1 Tax=Moraxella canis TaxID=90239 RepID=UPI000667D3DD|nr:hypothetical protein [Moraxella canis]